MGADTSHKNNCDDIQICAAYFPAVSNLRLRLWFIASVNRSTACRG